MPENRNWSRYLLGRAFVGLALAVVGRITAQRAGRARAAARVRLRRKQNAGGRRLSSPFKTVYESVSPAVVGIKVTTSSRVVGGRIMTSTSFAGSGVVISADGVVLTNYHVIDGAQGLSDAVSGEDEIPAALIAGDEDSDIAVLRASAENLTAAVLGDPDALSVGDWALVVGNPLGEQFVNTLSVGVVSGLDRDVRSQSSGRTGSTTPASMIQTDAAIQSRQQRRRAFQHRGRAGRRHQHEAFQQRLYRLRVD